MMRRWGSHGRRPAAYYEFISDGPRPAYDVERSTLWRIGTLGEEERDELEDEWRREFERSYDSHFFYTAAPGEILHGVRARRAHYAWADIPQELVEAWTAERRPRRRQGAPLEEAAVVK
jgi:hypothetical protein